MKKIGVFCKPKAPSGVTTLNKLIPWLEKRKHQVFLDKETATLINVISSHSEEEILEAILFGHEKIKDYCEVISKMTIVL